jgi:hypothetical protein
MHPLVSCNDLLDASSRLPLGLRSGDCINLFCQTRVTLPSFPGARCVITEQDFNFFEGFTLGVKQCIGTGLSIAVVIPWW